VHREEGSKFVFVHVAQFVAGSNPGGQVHVPLDDNVSEEFTEPPFWQTGVNWQFNPERPVMQVVHPVNLSKLELEQEKQLVDGSNLSEQTHVPFKLVVSFTFAIPLFKQVGIFAQSLPEYPAKQVLHFVAGSKFPVHIQLPVALVVSVVINVPPFAHVIERQFCPE